eukprot:TRINITY_DN23407_c0_g1_i2.p1 TRINITY_DN23407_c0_g1~~TRINITY_DN23407_c0_g1_i2.p1  ORF type:complete len:340 (+),score=63.30 TRINITY_DN23407_c0_g1_i2:23-1021(+)
MAFELVDYCLTFAASGLLFLVLLAVVLEAWRRFRKRRRKPNEGLFILVEWHHRIKEVSGGFVLIFIVLPLLVFCAAAALSGMLAAAEDWNFYDSYEYVIGNMIGIGPIVHLVPSTAFGKVCDIVVSIWAFILVGTVLGIAANLSFAVRAIGFIPSTVLGLLRALFLYVPILLVLLSFLCGAVLAALEAWSLEDGFVYMIGQVCGIADPLTLVDVSTDEGYFFLIFCYIIELAVSGVIVGLIGSHPAIEMFITQLEGQGESEDGEEADDKNLQEHVQPMSACEPVVCVASDAKDVVIINDTITLNLDDAAKSAPKSDDGACVSEVKSKMMAHL